MLLHPLRSCWWHLQFYLEITQHTVETKRVFFSSCSPRIIGTSCSTTIPQIVASFLCGGEGALLLSLSTGHWIYGVYLLLASYAIYVCICAIYEKEGLLSLAFLFVDICKSKFILMCVRVFVRKGATGAFAPCHFLERFPIESIQFAIFHPDFFQKEYFQPYWIVEK